MKNKIEHRIIQITAGQGPVECCRAVALTLKQFYKEAKSSNVSTTTLYIERGEMKETIKSVVIKVSGLQLYNFLENWIGTIHWISKSNYRINHKRKNWYIGIQEINQYSKIALNEKEVRFQTMRSSGAGGQHVNKVNSGVRAIHLPTKIQAVAMDNRSQHINRKIALERLKKKVEEKNLENITKDIQSKWSNHTKIERGNPIRSFEGQIFKPKLKNKRYKSTRQKLKNELKKELWD